MDEAVRVLKPGGRLIIADIRETQRYAEHLRELGMTNVTHHMLVPRGAVPFSLPFSPLVDKAVSATPRG